MNSNKHMFGHWFGTDGARCLAQCAINLHSTADLLALLRQATCRCHGSLFSLHTQVWLSLARHFLLRDLFLSGIEMDNLWVCRRTVGKLYSDSVGRSIERQRNLGTTP